jgi:hypothetical protein
MPTKLTWIVMMAVLLVATITALNAFPSQPDDEPRFTLREVMEAMTNKRMNIHFLVWVWSSDTLSFFVSKRANNWREPPNSLQLLAVVDTKNESASEDQTHTRKWIFVYNYSVLMWVWSSDALSFFVSKRANNWRDSNLSLQLLALCDTKYESASEDQGYTEKWIICIGLFVFCVSLSDGSVWSCCSS